MNLKHYYYYFKKAIGPNFIEDLKKYVQDKKLESAMTGSTVNEYIDQLQDSVLKQGLNKLSSKEKIDFVKKNNPKLYDDIVEIRQSDVVWLDDRWIYDELQPWVHRANEEAGWNFQWDWSETVQFTTYSSGGFYSFHQDSWPKPYPNTHQNPSFRGKIRKLSVTVTLSDPWEYEGGRLEFGFTNFREKEKAKIQQCTEILDKGSLVVFPSFVWHRVTPVTKGFRQSLVMWNLGHPWK